MLWFGAQSKYWNVAIVSCPFNPAQVTLLHAQFLEEETENYYYTTLNNELSLIIQKIAVINMQNSHKLKIYWINLLYKIKNINK